MSENKPFFNLPPSYTLGKYAIRRLIGRGRRTEVYRAFQPDEKRHIAIKIFHPGSPRPADFDTRFQKEGRAIAGLKHDNIIRVYDLGIQDTIYYMVMELIEGTSLRELISANPTGLNRNDMMLFFHQIANAVAHAHDHQIVHGNIKPDNVLIDGSKRAVLTDFSIPCLVAMNDVTPAAYLAPEQAAQNTVTPLSDIYTLGILLYEMATGDLPFKADTREKMIELHLHGQPMPPSQKNVTVDSRLDRVTLKALSKNPAERYENVHELLSDLDNSEARSQYDTVSLGPDSAESSRKRHSENS